MTLSAKNDQATLLRFTIYLMAFKGPFPSSTLFI